MLEACDHHFNNSPPMSSKIPTEQIPDAITFSARAAVDGAPGGAATIFFTAVPRQGALGSKSWSYRSATPG